MASPSKLKIAFSDFWFGLDPERNFFTDLLRTRFAVEISTEPDVLFCSTFGNEWANYGCPRILFVGENISPDFRLFDASLSFMPTSDRNYYLPLFRLFTAYQLCYQERKISYERWSGKKKIGTVFSNKESRFRSRTFQYLNRAIGVDSGGKAFNNVGGPVADKGAFLEAYRFSMAFENTRWPGYATEKLVEAYGFDTVPIYWGDPNIGDWFNMGAFLNVEGPTDLSRLAAELDRIGGDFEEYRKIYEQPLFRGNAEPEPLKSERILDFLEAAVIRGLRRKRRGPVREFQAFKWSSRWKYKQWDYRLRHLIRLMSLFTILFFIPHKMKPLAKRLLRRAE